MTQTNGSATTVLDLFKPSEIRSRSQGFLRKAEQDELGHVAVDLDRLPIALIKVLETTKAHYPDFQIPPFGIWRDLEIGGFDRWAALAGARGFESAETMLSAAADLAILCVYLKTAHPAGWSYEDPASGQKVDAIGAPSLAGLNMLVAGSFSSNMSDPFRVDAETLTRLETEELAFGLQWDPVQDASMLQNMQRHLKRIGEALALRPDLFSKGEVTRPGLLASQLAFESNGPVDANSVLDHLLQALAPVWDGGAIRDNVTLGDSFDYQSGNKLEDVVPFHLAAQEMVYALVEPFAWAGYEVANLNDLTPPANLPHAALFFETGVLSLKTLPVDLDENTAIDRMVEIRTLVTALTDKVAELLRAELNVSSDDLPLSCILEGGTNRAGVEILRENEGLRDKLGKLLNPGSVFWLPFGA